ncbi:MAG: NAD(P)-dependent oxidoreductase [Pseudomonadota bacterium]
MLSHTENRAIVTGGSGGLGAEVIRQLLGEGYECLNLDIQVPQKHLCPYQEIDLCDRDALLKVCRSDDVIIHLGGMPHPDDAGDFSYAAKVFANNTLSTYNCFNVAATLGMQRLIWASSETVYGYPFEQVAPMELPLDEQSQPQPQNSYAISKLVSEQVAVHFHQLYDIDIIGLRLANVVYPGTEHPCNYPSLKQAWEDPLVRKFNLWNYIDVRDAAAAVVRSLDADITGAHNLNIVANETVMPHASEGLVASVFSHAEARATLSGNQALLGNARARELLNWSPVHNWRDVLQQPGSGRA